MEKISLAADQKILKKEFGYIVYKIDNKDCTIDYIEINKNRRGEGLGRELLYEFITLQKEKNINYFELEAFITENATIKDLEALSNFYKSLGFLESGRDTEDKEEARIYLFLEFYSDKKILFLYLENSLEKKYEKTAIEIYQKFLNSEPYKNYEKGFYSLQDSLNIFISFKEYLNSYIEKNDFILLSNYIKKKLKSSSNH